MKNTFLFLILSIFVISQTRSENLSSLESVIEDTIVEYNSKSRVTDEKLKSVLYQINIYTYSAERISWDHPSQKDLKKLINVAETLEPLVPILLQVLQSPEQQKLHSRIYNILQYAKPSQYLKEGLLKIATNPKKPSEIESSLEIIFQKELEDERVKKIVLSSLEEKFQDKNSFIYCDALNMSSRWRLPETIPYYKRFIEREIQESTGKSYTVQVIAEAVQNMGESARELRPLLEQYLTIVKNTPQEQPSLENSIIWAIETIDGKRQPRPWGKTNGSGIRQATPDPLWYEKIVSQLHKEGNLPEILAKQKGTKHELQSKLDSTNQPIGNFTLKTINEKSVLGSGTVFGVTKRNLLSALMMAGGGALLVMTLLYAFWPRQK